MLDPCLIPAYTIVMPAKGVKGRRYFFFYKYRKSPDSLIIWLLASECSEWPLAIGCWLLAVGCSECGGSGTFSGCQGLISDNDLRLRGSS
ncbi:MAG: hypothetical protein EPN37_13805 [Chitinophagaceae bacterium]|nr:MAG: hypothetical protein EPN37_13805 [Chitinophagaceae bacterium]